MKTGAAPIILSHSKIKDATPLFEHNYFKESVSITDFLNNGSNDSGDDDGNDNFDGDKLTTTNHLRESTNVNSKNRLLDTIEKCSRESSNEEIQKGTSETGQLAKAKSNISFEVAVLENKIVLTDTILDEIEESYAEIDENFIIVHSCDIEEGMFEFISIT